jgi:hypothetical protein
MAALHYFDIVVDSKKVVILMDTAYLPEWTEEELRGLAVLGAGRLDGLVQLLIERGLVTRAEYQASVQKSFETRMPGIVRSLAPELPTLPAGFRA